MNRLAVIGCLFALAGLCEIAGGYLVWGYLRQGKPLFWALLGAAVLVSYGVVAALQPIPAFGRATRRMVAPSLGSPCSGGSPSRGFARTCTTSWVPSSPFAGCS